MLKGISPLISPELLKVLCEMGHGDEIVFADAHFPANTFNENVLRLDGVQIAGLLKGVLELFELDSYVPDPIIMMAPVPGDELDESVEARYLESINSVVDNDPQIERVDRFDFYERAKGAFAVVLTGELAKYGNILIKKGVTPTQ